MLTAPKHNEQLAAVLAELRSILRDDLLAVYLHGSAASGRLQRQSDIDLLAVVDRPLTEDQRMALLGVLLRLSGRYPADPDGPRCLEVMVFSRHDLMNCQHPARAEFVYGEWLRSAFEAGEMPEPPSDPEFTLVLAQSRQDAISLYGPEAERFLPKIPMKMVGDAMRDLLPALVAGLEDDTRNVLLTLARMWRTALHWDFVSKDEAASWAIPNLAPADAQTLDYARRAYLGQIADDWRELTNEARTLADHLALQIGRSLQPVGP